ncbi:hypothetical protein HKD37_13G035298 [Glycine soja]
MSDGFCGTHLQIMVRTRGLGRALGQVTGRGVGREDHADSDDAPQRRRPTASARRQRCWIYEHFPSVTESTADQDYDEASPCACRWIATKKTVKSFRTPAYRERLDQLRIPDVCWIPYGEHREFGYTQTIPAPPVDSWVSYDDIHDRWMHYEDHIVSASEPRVVPQAPQTDIPHVPEPGASSTSVEEPRHAVEICDDIAERSERHLSLGVVTPGSSTHEVIEECLKLVRSVTQDHLVYVRSRRRRRTDQA